MDFSADDALTAIRLRAFLPDGDQVWTDTNLLFLLNEELQTWAVPFLSRVRAEYFTKHVDYGIVAGQTDYAIPSAAIGGVLRNVQVVDTQGNIWPLMQLDNKELGPALTGNPWSFVVEGDMIRFAQTPLQVGWKLRMTYANRPSTVVKKAQCAQVYSFTGLAAGSDITFVSTPGGNVTTLNDPLTGAVDWVRGGSSFQTYSQTTTVFGPVSDPTYEILGAPLPTGLQPYDWLCAPNTSPFPQIPCELHPALHQRVAAKVLEFLGDDKAEMAMQRFTEMAAQVQDLIAPRVQGSPKALRGTLSRGYSNRWGGYGWGV